MQEAEIYRQLTEIFHEVFMRDDIVLRPDLTARDVAGWDSFKQVEIMIAAEEVFGFKFHTKEVDALGNVGDLVRVLMAKATPPRAGA